MLATLLASIAGERIFIACRIEPKPDQPGKTNKIPVNPLTGLPSNAQDPATWLTLAEALATGYSVGIVIHERLGLFCVDIDGALQSDNTWSPLATALCQRFAGAYIEVSASGTGLHIFGRHTGIPDHRVKRKGLQLEIYTRARFILLTGTNAAGNIQTDHTTQLLATIAECFPEPVVQHTDEWTTGPIVGWRGGGTDEQIIASLRNRQSAHATFGMGASFADLFDANSEALARAFPSSNGKDWDGSAADQALANHIAWATGFDCDRTLHLMMQSKLARDKWQRDDYLPRTIRNAVAGKIPAGIESQPIPPSSTPIAMLPAPALIAPGGSWPPPAPVHDALLSTSRIQALKMDSAPNPGAFMTQSEQEALFKGCVYIEDIHGILMPDGSILAQKQFNVRFGGYDFQMRPDGTKQTTDPWDAFTSSQLVKFPRAHGLTFDPRLEPRAIIHRDNFVFLNSWVPVPIVKTPGDISPFLTHLYTLYPNGQDAQILLAYFAFLVQYIGTKAQWWPMLQGVEGNGKTFFSLALEYCIGQRYTHHAKASQIDSRFNSAFYGKLLICIEDVQITEAKAAMWETLKPMITNPRMEIEGKGLDKVSRDVCFNGVMNSNYKDGVRKTRNDRRVAPFFAAQQYASDLVRCGLTKQYFQNLYNWARNGGFAHIADFLTHYPIPDELNPAVGAIRAPETSSTEQAISVGRGSVEQEVQEAIDSGREGFRGGWVNSIAFDRLLREVGKERFVPRAKRPELLEAIGYRPHPKLPGGRCIYALPDGTKPTLYIRDGHPTQDSEAGFKGVPLLYVKDQAPEK